MAPKGKARTPTSGIRPPGQGQPVTLKMLAAHLGLSPAAVSLVINDSPAAQSIPAKTQDRIEHMLKTGKPLRN